MISRRRARACSTRGPPRSPPRWARRATLSFNTGACAPSPRRRARRDGRRRRRYPPSRALARRPAARRNRGAAVRARAARALARPVVVLDHEPIAGLMEERMSMPFIAASADLFRGIAVGDRVAFALAETSDALLVVSLERLSP